MIKNINFSLKVKLKGMNSYENRLNDLKQLTKETDDKELINEIEKFALKWSDTYLLISKCLNFLFIFRNINSIISLRSL